MTDPLSQLKLDVLNEKIVIGGKRTIKFLKLGKVKRVYLASNAPKTIEEDIKYYASLQNIPIYKLNISNEELGGFMKKPFKVAVVSVVHG